MELKNLVEEEVIFIVDSIIKEMEDVCTCNQCKLDIIAIALNNLKPKYVVTEKGYAFSKANNLNPQFNTDVVKEVTKAIEIVKNNPRH